MATYIHGTFKNINNDNIEVQIRSELGTKEYVIGEDDNSKLFFDVDPVTIETECEDMFTNIIKKSCKITLVTSLFLGDVLFAANEKSVTVKVFKNDNIIFDGFVEPNTYSQPWANQLETFEINCIDYLGCLQYEYITDTSNYANVKQQNNIYSFKHYLQDFLPSNTYWDKSKLVDNESVFEKAGVSLNVFLGDDEDDLMNNEEILKEILQYCNLHIMQEGSNFIIFDWNTIINKSTSIWYNIFDSSTITIPTYDITVNKDRYASNDTNLSMSEVYNQIVATCEFEEKEELVSSPLNDDDIIPYVNIKQKFLREYISSGDGSAAQDGFKEIVKSGYDGSIPYSDYDGWTCREWYFKWNYNPSWKLRYCTEDIEKFLEVDENGNYINQWKILERLKNNYRFMPALLSIGKSDVELSRNNQKQNGSISMTDYLVISCNGNGVDSDDEADRIDYDNSYAAAFGSAHKGLLEYVKGESGIYSPVSNNTTNYLIFGGKFILNPIMYISGALNPNKIDTTFKTVYDTVDNISPSDTENISDNDNGAFYAQQFYGSRNPKDEQTPMNTTNLIYPFVNENKQRLYEYNYSDHGDSTDKFDKVPVLECMLRIGNKYLKEIETGNFQKTDYIWTTEESYFTLGFDPNIGDYIIGKEWELANTVNGRYSDERGTAIPIHKEDELSGDVEFRIIGVVNTWWNDITRRHPTLFRHTKYYDNYKLLLNHVSSIWIKDFKIKIISDNEGYDIANQSKDLMYMSLEQQDYIKKKDDIEFKINTMPTTEELINLGISSNVSNTNVVNLGTNKPLETMTDTTTNQTDRPERLFIDCYYKLYSKPKIILETTLKDNTTYPFANMYNFTGFTNMIPLSVNKDLKYNSIYIRCRQI